MNATKVSNKEHEVTMELDSQVQPLPCKVAAEKRQVIIKKGMRLTGDLPFQNNLNVVFVVVVIGQNKAKFDS